MLKIVRSRDCESHEEYVRGRFTLRALRTSGLAQARPEGTYVAVEPFHLDRYVDEQVFRYNNRATKDNPLERRGSLHAGCIADFREETDLCRTDRQGGRNGVLT
jgi:hypothetical protein